MTQGMDSDTMGYMNENEPQVVPGIITEPIGLEDDNPDEELEPVAINDAMLLDGHPGHEDDYTEEPEPIVLGEWPLADNENIGQHVKEHDALIDVQYILGVDASGKWDIETLRAVKEFQRVNGLEVTRVLDKPTWEALKQNG